MTMKTCVSYKCWHLPHMGDSESFYEDSYHPKIGFHQIQSNGSMRFAVADGVSGAYFSGGWASQLTALFGKSGKTAFYNVDTLKAEAKKWVQDELEKAEIYYFDEPDEVKDIAEQIQTEGGAATVHGLELNITDEELFWDSFSIGDSCMFHIRNGEIISQSPKLSYDEFGYSPEQISTLYPEEEYWNSITASGTFQIGDVFLLATDAFSSWLITPHDSYPVSQKIQDVISLESQQAFNVLISQEREAKRMEDDDVTLSLIKVTRPRELMSGCMSCKRMNCSRLPLRRVWKGD